MLNKSFLKFLITIVALLFGFYAVPGLTNDQNNSDDCSKGGALEQTTCFRIILHQKQEKINNLIEQVMKNQKSIWGKEADEENKRRIKSTQDAWYKYVKDHCIYGYYTKASVHPPSQDLRITMCEVKKAQERIDEIKNDYFSK